MVRQVRRVPLPCSVGQGTDSWPAKDGQLFEGHKSSWWRGEGGEKMGGQGDNCLRRRRRRKRRRMTRRRKRKWWVLNCDGQRYGVSHKLTFLPPPSFSLHPSIPPYTPSLLVSALTQSLFLSSCPEPSISLSSLKLSQTFIILSKNTSNIFLPFFLPLQLTRPS